MTLDNVPFGQTAAGEPVELFTLADAIRVRVITYGATITSIEVPDRTGALVPVTLGFDRLVDYETRSPYFGATIGRVANRIAGGRFTLDGQTYQLPLNDGPNHLHGCFHARLFRARTFDEDGRPGVAFHYLSPDGEGGYPGALEVEVRMVLSAPRSLTIDYRAVASRATPVNLTNHSYFNLDGAGQGTVLDHRLQLHASHYTPVDATAIPTGAIEPVRGTPFDFEQPHAIGERLAAVPGGYDHNYVLDRGLGPGPFIAARVTAPRSGRSLEVLTTEPGLQFYSGNFLDGSIDGIPKHGAFCLEAQHFPDAVNHPNFPSVILQPGHEYVQTTVYRFL